MRTDQRRDGPMQPAEACPKYRSGSLPIAKHASRASGSVPPAGEHRSVNGRNRWCTMVLPEIPSLTYAIVSAVRSAREAVVEER
jgi:hypothetical protein